MTKLKLLASSMVLMCWFAPAMAEEVVCPQSIDVDQKIESVPGGFVAYIQDGPHQSCLLYTSPSPRDS